MTDVRLYLRNGVFVPCGDDDYDKVHALAKNSIYRCKVFNDRNYDFLKKYMKLMRVAWAGLNEVQSKCFNDSFEAFQHSVEMEAGNVEPIYSFKRNEIVLQRKSISFDNMSEKAFQDLFERVKDVLINVVFRKCQDKEYLNMIMEF